MQSISRLIKLNTKFVRQSNNVLYPSLFKTHLNKAYYSTSSSPFSDQVTERNNYEQINSITNDLLNFIRNENTQQKVDLKLQFTNNSIDKLKQVQELVTSESEYIDSLVVLYKGIVSTEVDNAVVQCKQHQNDLLKLKEAKEKISETKSTEDYDDIEELPEVDLQAKSIDRILLENDYLNSILYQLFDGPHGVKVAQQLILYYKIAGMDRCSDLVLNHMKYYFSWNRNSVTLQEGSQRVQQLFYKLIENALKLNCYSVALQLFLDYHYDLNYFKPSEIPYYQFIAYHRNNKGHIYSIYWEKMLANDFNLEDPEQFQKSVEFYQESLKSSSDIPLCKSLLESNIIQDRINREKKPEFIKGLTPEHMVSVLSKSHLPKSTTFIGGATVIKSKMTSVEISQLDTLSYQRPLFGLQVYIQHLLQTNPDAVIDCIEGTRFRWNSLEVSLGIYSLYIRLNRDISRNILSHLLKNYGKNKLVTLHQDLARIYLKYDVKLTDKEYGEYMETYKNIHGKDIDFSDILNRDIVDLQIQYLYHKGRVSDAIKMIETHGKDATRHRLRLSMLVNSHRHPIPPRSNLKYFDYTKFYKQKYYPMWLNHEHLYYCLTQSNAISNKSNLDLFNKDSDLSQISHRGFLSIIELNAHDPIYTLLLFKKFYKLYHLRYPKPLDQMNQLPFWTEIYHHIDTINKKFNDQKVQAILDVFEPLKISEKTTRVIKDIYQLENKSISI
ncbi:hypothetical protein DLAC_04572 [Tieghemostelium lacteum]|uniref:Uncharacterized protein n=1 Tax=Tieghemostelium lacteum TaxID=361077 RepID=A0A151ZJW8_TIELA|nr:hypothetical protein DLAC_04572 [Tieghemostelium lacteum]|eukprot:KYQ94273.1 hypothetical protein DLAC_04572 [Tieghemostelium lacteum]